MAPPEASNVDFFNLKSSVTALDRALEDADRQKTFPKGARTLPAHKPLEELHKNVKDDLGRVLNSPLRPVTGPAYGCLPLEAVQPIRQLHKLLYQIVGPGGDEDLLDDPDVAADLHRRFQAFVASVVPDHPFLKVKSDEFKKKKSDNDVGHDDYDADEQQQQRTPSAKGKGKQVADDKQ